MARGRVDATDRFSPPRRRKEDFTPQEYQTLNQVLDLAISEAVTEYSSLRNIPGKGCIFIVHLPLELRHGAVERPPAPAKP